MLENFQSNENTQSAQAAQARQALSEQSQTLRQTGDGSRAQSAGVPSLTIVGDDRSSTRMSVPPIGIGAPDQRLDSSTTKPSSNSQLENYLPSDLQSYKVPKPVPPLNGQLENQLPPSHSDKTPKPILPIDDTELRKHNDMPVIPDPGRDKSVEEMLRRHEEKARRKELIDDIKKKLKMLEDMDSPNSMENDGWSGKFKHLEKLPPHNLEKNEHLDKLPRSIEKNLDDLFKKGHSEPLDNDYRHKKIDGLKELLHQSHDSKKQN